MGRIVHDPFAVLAERRQSREPLSEEDALSRELTNLVRLEGLRWCVEEDLQRAIHIN